jgi:hypothetical protein
VRRIVLLTVLALASGCARDPEQAPATAQAAVPGLETQPVTEIELQPELSAWAMVAPPLAPALRDARAERQASEARAALAGQQLNRLLARGPDSAVAAKEIEAARAELEMAGAARERARAQEAEFGAARGAAGFSDGAPTLTIQVTQRDLLGVHKGAKVRFRPDDGSARELRGSVAGAPSYVDPATGLAPVAARLDGAEGLVPGTTGSAWIEAGPLRRVLSVPREAVVFDGERFQVFVVRGDAAPAALGVELGEAAGDRVEVQGALAAGARVVTTGAASLLSAAKLPSEADDE